MSNSTPESTISQLSAKIDDMALGLKWMFALFLIVLSVPNLCVSLSIPHFSEIFQDVLPGKRIRYWTFGTAIIAFIIGAQLLVTWVSLFLPMVQLMTGLSDLQR